MNKTAEFSEVEEVSIEDGDLDIFNEGEEDSEEVIPQSTEGEVEVTAEAEEPAAPATEPEPEPPAPTPATPEVPKAPVIPIPQPPQPTVPDEAAAARYEQETLTRLEQTYALVDEDTIAQLQTEPELVLPKLAARIHFEVARDTLKGVQSILPQLIEQIQAEARETQSAWDSFYAVNTDLKGQVQQDQVLKVAQMYRAANPTAPQDVAIQTIGNIIRMSLGIAPVTAAATTNPAPSTQPTAPAATRTVVKPFTPSGVNAAPAAQVKDDNPWAALAEDGDFWDKG